MSVIFDGIAHQVVQHPHEFFPVRRNSGQTVRNLNFKADLVPVGKGLHELLDFF